MPVCFFDANYDNKYTCDYEIKEGVLEVEVNYNIMDEVPVINGMRKLGTDTEFKTKDILIVDYHLKRNILAKNAWFAGTSGVWGTPDGGSVAKYRANLYFEHSDSEKLANLPQTPKAKKIKIFSKAILDWIGMPSLEHKKTNSYVSYKLSKEYEGASIEINKNYIKQITVSDSWDTLRKTREKSISIDFMGYLELELTKKVDYISLPQFVNEIQVFMQLYCPDRFIIEKIHVMIDDIYYVFNMPLLEIKNNGKYMERTVDEDVLPFLKKCYAQIPYRNSKTEIRNIPYIVLKTHRSIEDSFLMFYRFVECYYKKAEPKDKKKFLSFGFLNHYIIKHMGIEKVNIYGIPDELQQTIYDAVTSTHAIRHTRGAAARDLEFSSVTKDKSKAVESFMKTLHFTYDDTFAIGDSSTDYDAIRMAKIGVAMGNAPDDIKSIANYVTAPNTEDGFAQAVEHFLL